MVKKKTDMKTAHHRGQILHLTDKTQKHDLILLPGDFNSKVGNDFGAWGKIIGKHGI